MSVSLHDCLHPTVFDAKPAKINIIDGFQEILLMAENIPMSASYLIIQMDMVAWCGQLLDHARRGRHFRSV
jgi:hypothetical protein